MEKLITETVGNEPYQYYPLGEYVVRAPGVCNGRPTFKYTRIEITGTLDRLAAGENMDQIVAGYRNTISREAVIEAIQLIASQFVKSLPQLETA
ncbi:MAG: hypothetical protein CNIPEHKO_03573 [Anaerolineales bacterium]|nr:DUF433 domain-containing protein [Anaerolineae bacterium]MBL8104411.1 DUF433 domain-containing protein [Anaerolineales bacterium]MBV6403236.1 hypothetical protein [Anaerolineales bacterium]MCC7187609.1 DUF433 domain-containing protein [Anaerolineales bacterium]HQU37671.1 DUF433 domain-containing protein [Anaerolineales bacterium]